jgi:phosphoribosylaminoimidazole carboxylase (NCAIR synthetase)
MRDAPRSRLLLLLPTATYQAAAFVEAARRVGVDLTVASEQPSSLSDHNPSGFLTLDFSNIARAAAAARAFAERHPVSGVYGVDDNTAVLAAAIGEALDLPHNPLPAVQAARDKRRQRETLSQHNVPIPAFWWHALSDDPRTIAAAAPYPCVVKPVALSASRGVIRANDPEEFLSARDRLAAILEAANSMGALRHVGEGREDEGFLVEEFVPGAEFALEGLLVRGRLHVLALFDKPDPLDGPFFEETIYVTPSRHPSSVQDEIAQVAEDAAQALGLERGPVHAELRYNERGPWLIELAARQIGGKCGQVLRFGKESEWSLEELLLRDNLGILDRIPMREQRASGVMMIPTPARGFLREATGVEAARNVAGVTDVMITAHRGQELVPPPEGSRYLGFIFAGGGDPASVEASIREAHGKLTVEFGED